MKGAIVHGVLLAVMLVYGYRTWTREKSVEPTLGSVVVWNRPITDVQAVLFTSPRKSVRLERRTEGAETYWWGVESRTDRRLKPLPDSQKQATMDAGAPADAGVPPAAGGDAGVPGDAGAAAPAEAAEEAKDEVITTTTEFPVGPTGDDIVQGVASMRAIRALGALSDETKKEYGLEIGDTSLAVIFKNGTRTFVIGNKVSGGKERYAIDPDSNVGYVVAGTFIEPMESGPSQLKPSDPKGFDPALLASVGIKAGDKTREASRLTTTNEKGDQTKTWGNAATKKPDQTMANFIDNVDRLRPSTFDTALKVADLKPVVELTYKDDRGRKLATLALYKRERAAEPPADGTADPTTPPPPVAEYYIVTEKTRVPALVSKGSAERIEQDVATLLAQ